ncbi:hypothetical protein KEM56_002789 [Ascosphaera pollenicola]|nr:hypothetical protein KEM56_002789 [Ascosphaera pollenicola]
MTTSGRSFISHRRVARDEGKKNNKPVEPSVTTRPATAASTATLHKGATHKSVGGQLISRVLAPKGSKFVASAPAENAPVLRRKPASIGQSTEPSVASSQVHVMSTPTGTTSNPIGTQGFHSLGSAPGTSPASFSQRVASSGPATKRDVPLHAGASYSALASYTPIDHSTVCLRPATTPSSAALSSTLGAAPHDAQSPSVGSYPTGRRLVSSPSPPVQSREPSSHSNAAVNAVGGTRNRSHTVSSKGKSSRVDTNSKALPTPPNREGIDGYIPISYSRYQTHLNPQISSVKKVSEADTRTSAMQSSLPDEIPFTDRATREVATDLHQPHSLTSPTTSAGSSPRPGPVAGTGHEGYGKFAPKPCRRKSVLRRQRSVRAQGLGRSASVGDDLNGSATRNNASSSPPYIRAQNLLHEPDIVGYCISPTPRLDLRPVTSVTPPPATSPEATRPTSAPKKKKLPKLNWAFIKHLCGAGSAKEPEELTRPNEDAASDTNDHQSIIILPPPPPKDDPNALQAFSMSDVGPPVPPKSRHLPHPSDMSSIHHSVETSAYCCRSRTASNVTIPRSIASSAPSFPSISTDMTEEELWSEYDDFLDDISNISNSLDSASPCRQTAMGQTYYTV